MIGRRVHVTGAMGDNVLIEVDHIRHATLRAEAAGEAATACSWANLTG